MDSYKNAYDLWLDKTRKVQDSPTSEVAEAGTLFEPGVIDWAEKSLGPLKRNVELIIEEFHLMGHLDAQVVDNNEPVEAKTSGLFGPLNQDWGEANTDELPDRVIVQCHGQMVLSDTEICHVPAFLGGRGFVMYYVERDKTIADEVVEMTLDFWEHVERDDPPANIVPSVAFVKRLKRIPEKVVQIEPELIIDWLRTKSNVKWAEQLKDDAEAAMLTALGDAEAAEFVLENERKMLTYFEQSQKRIDSKKLKEELPEIAKQYIKESRFRVARIKKIKK
jgi:predicted phage-related endonuclease